MPSSALHRLFLCGVALIDPSTNALKNLKTLAVSTDPAKTGNGKVAPKSSIPDCCICKCLCQTRRPGRRSLRWGCSDVARY